jgi:hypothetical protein
MLNTFKVGDYARNVESGWLGKILEFRTETVQIDDDRSYQETMAKMIGVDLMANLIVGMSRERSLSRDDIQYHDVNDLTIAMKIV